MKTCPLITAAQSPPTQCLWLKKTSRGIRESHLKSETSVEKAPGEANYLFRAVIANQHFFKTVIVPFILLAVQTPPLPVNTAVRLQLIGSWTASQTQRYREWFAWTGSDKKCLCAGAPRVNAGLVPERNSVNINMESYSSAALMEPLKSLKDNNRLRWHRGVQVTRKKHSHLCVLAGAFTQSDSHCIRGIHFVFYHFLLSLNPWPWCC